MSGNMKYCLQYAAFWFMTWNDLALRPSEVHFFDKTHTIILRWHDGEYAELEAHIRAQENGTIALTFDWYGTQSKDYTAADNMTAVTETVQRAMAALKAGRVCLHLD